MQIIVPLTLTIEITDESEKATYFKCNVDGSISTDLNPEYINDIFADGVTEMLVYGDAKVTHIDNLTATEAAKSVRRIS